MNRVGIETIGSSMAALAPELAIGGAVAEQQIMLAAATRFAEQFGNGVSQAVPDIEAVFASEEPLPVAKRCMWMAVPETSGGLRAAEWVTVR